MKNKILILGSSGMAGHVVKMYLDHTNQFEIYDVARSDNYVKPYFIFDITDFKKLTQIICSNSFDYIINCVGILNKISEENPDCHNLMEIIRGKEVLEFIRVFTDGELPLTGLRLLPELNGFKFKDLTLARQRRFLRVDVRFRIFTGVDEEVKRYLTNR